MHHIATILFVGIGIASLAFSIAHEAYWWRRRHWIQARGVVKGCKESWDDGTRYFAEIQFKGTGGPKTFVSQYGSNRKPMIGSEVKIVINPSSEAAAEVSRSHRILLPLAFFLFGIIAIAVGLSVKPITDGEQASAYDGGQHPSLISGFPPRRAWPIRCAKKMKRRNLLSILLLGAPMASRAESPKPVSKPGRDAEQSFVLEDLLASVVHDVLSREKFAKNRSFYGTDSDRSLVLSNSPWSIPWPRSLAPQVEGWKIIGDHEYQAPAIATVDGKPLQEYQEVARKLALRLDAISRDLEDRRPLSYLLTVSLFNAGGAKNGGVIGAHRYEYSCQYAKGKWSVELVSASS